MNRGLLVIGGGILQIPALERARALGITTYLTDGFESCRARNYADHFYRIDVNDAAKTSELARNLRRENKIDGVYTQGTDVEYTVACAAEAAGLFGIRPEVALNCKSKVRMRDILRKVGIDHMKFMKAKNGEDFEQALSHVGFPCFVKPADNSASRGIQRLRNSTDGMKAFENAFRNCLGVKEVLVEEEIPGPEYSVDTIMHRNRLYPAGISDRQFLDKREYAVQKNSTTPSLLPEHVQAEMFSLMERAALALGVSDGAFKGDLVIDNRDGQAKIIEVAARTSGGFDSQLRKPYSFGIDLMKATMDIARGMPLDPIDLIPKWIKWSRTFSIFVEPGVVTGISGLEQAKRTVGVRNIFMLVDKGDVVEDYVDCARRTNHIVISADSLEELNKLEEQIRSTITIHVEKK